MTCMYIRTYMYMTYTHTHALSNITTPQALGQLGRVQLVHDDGDVIVIVNGRRWTMNPACLLHAPGEKLEEGQ